MLSRWLLLLLLLILNISFSACRKNKTSAPVIVPELPGGGGNAGEDTVDNPPDGPDPLPPTYQQLPVYERMGANVGGYYEALPLSYDSSDKTFPLLVFLHGGGELGDGGPEQLPLILKNSVTDLLDEKKFPVSFNVDGQTFSFIIVSPQFLEWPEVQDVHDVIEHSLSKYRVDRSRIYICGLSMGGGAAWEYAGSQYGNRLAAIVPICGASWADSAVAKKIAQNDVPAWAFHNEDDQAVTVNSTRRYVRLINAEDPKYPVKVTYWPTGGHDAWTKSSDPEYREEGKNIYEWMLQFTR